MIDYDNTPEGWFHNTPAHIFQYMYSYAYLGYRPGEGWKYLTHGHMLPEEFTLNGCKEYTSINMPVWIDPAVVSLMYKKRVLVKIGKDLSVVEYETQHALGLNPYMKIRMLKESIRLADIERIFGKENHE